MVLSADEAYIHNNEGSRNARVQQHDGVANIGYWTDAEAWVEWSFEIDRPGRYQVLAEVAIEADSTRFYLILPYRRVSVEARSTGGYGKYASRGLGGITLDEPGEYTLQIRPERSDWQPMNLRQIELKLQ